MPEELIALLMYVILLAGMLAIHLLYRKTKPLTGHDVAQKLGIKFSPEKTRDIQPGLAFINRLQYGKRHYALNVFSGRYKKQKVLVFDFRYEIETITGRGGTTIEDPYCFYTLELPRCLPEVTIYKEGMFSKVIQAAGDNDIDFESHEFSRKFRVRSPDPRFAYDFCNVRMNEYLLQNTDLSIEVDRNILCISFDKPLNFEEVEHNLKRLVAIRNLMPNYIFEE
jgi:hypothetical protein